ncbi:MAG: hypothetical protein GF384_08255 [Elusimicrobia bacterium]|nr:hypothetical protein [Elusimicrobiota bacterium]MBD3412619.1 hypothetical protein [Elusimicrobiota bacterium]
MKTNSKPLLIRLSQNRLFPAAVGLVMITGSLVVFRPLVERLTYESAHTDVRLCGEFQELAELAKRSNKMVGTVLEEFKSDGLTTVALFPQVSEEVSDQGFSRSAMDDIIAAGLELLVRPYNPLFLDEQTFRTRLLTRDMPDAASLFLTAGDEAYGYPHHLSLTASLLNQRALRTAWLEFGGQRAGKTLARLSGQSPVRTHSVDVKELAEIPDRETIIHRLFRAVRERSVRMLYVHLLPEHGLTGNRAYIRRLKTGLTQRGYALRATVPPSFTTYLNMPDAMRNGIALIIGWLIPVAAIITGLFILRHTASPYAWIFSFFAVNLVTITGGLCIAGTLAAPQYLQGLQMFRGVKLTMLVPLILLALLCIDRRQCYEQLHRPVLWKEVLVLGVFGFMVLIMLARSGNSGLFYFPHGVESSLRDLLERLLIFRPRTKEFLIGQPLLLFVMWYIQQNRRDCVESITGFVCIGIIVSSIGQISIINTFLHIHTPVVISLIRTAHGLWIGVILGLIAIAAWSAGRTWYERH